MVDHQLRNLLSDDLREFVIGRMAIDEFDDAFHELYFDADDDAVKQIASFGTQLSDDYFLQRLKNYCAVKPSTRRVVARCLLFLKTELPYEWPAMPWSVADEVLHTVCFLGIPAGISLLICSVPFLVGGVADVEFLWPVAALGAAIFGGSIWYRRCPGGHNSSRWKSWRASGDFDAWPFLHREDFCQARRTAHLLNNEAT